MYHQRLGGDGETSTIFGGSGYGHDAPAEMRMGKARNLIEAERAVVVRPPPARPHGLQASVLARRPKGGRHAEPAPQRQRPVGVPSQSCQVRASRWAHIFV